jgi:hypothetical protein
MADVFSSESAKWSYEARIPAVLRSTQLPLPAQTASESAAIYAPSHDAHYWEQQTQGLDFNSADRIDSARFNQILWKGMMGEDQPYPAERDGKDLRENRSQ